MKQLFTCLCAALIFLSSCGKNTDDTYTQPNVIINITSPTSGQTFSDGDTLHLAAQVSSPVELHGYTWSVHRNSDDSTLTEIEKHTHEQAFNTNTDWIIPAGTAGNLTVKLIVEIDHEGHEAVRTVGVKVLP